MKRVLAIAFVLCVSAAAAFTGAGAGGSNDASKYTVEIDNAFGLVTGADLKIAGVRAGKITKLRLDRKSKRALVDFTVTKTGFGSLRTDVFCETRPQSLIGEYFIDCDPGKAAGEWPRDRTIPVAKTASTVPGDLVNNILRRPYRERLRIILNELGAGVGGRSEDLNEAIRRGSPALRETNKVLAKLARQNQVIAELVTDADVVLHDLSENREDVARWAKETKETATASAERREDIRGSLQRLPTFLKELRPYMVELGNVADAQRPALADLNASANGLETLFKQLKPFSESTLINLRSLADTARVGRPAVKAARPFVAQLGKASEKLPELANNLEIVLKDLDDRGRAVEPDPRSPGGKGYTGFEALLQYFFDQTMAINVFDANSYQLKVNLFVGECSDYQNADSLKAKLAEDPKFYERCASIVGPQQQGINAPDPTRPASAGERRRTRREARQRREADARQAPDREKTAPMSPAGNQVRDEVKPPIDLRGTLDDLLGGKLPGTTVPPVDPGPGIGRIDRPALLDFLLGS